jgi:penicillin-binding protein 2
MSRAQPLKEPWREQRLFFGRIAVAAIMVLLLSAALIARLIQLQVQNHEHFSDLSRGNRLRIEPLPPIRGLIFDRNGVVLAENRPTWQLLLTPEDVADIPYTLNELTADGFIPVDDRARIDQLVKSQRRFEPVTLRYRVAEEDAYRFSVSSHRFPGVVMRPRLSRHYPFGAPAAHALGYVGSISVNDLERIDRSNYAGTAQIGKTGVEHRYEERLHGKVGYRQQVVNARGRILQGPTAAFLKSADAVAGNVDARLPTPGDNVILGLDIRLQLVAYEALGDFRGAAVGIDTSSGDVLFLVSTPAFDPNLFTSGISIADYQALNQDPNHPLFNRALSGSYPPGSTIKPFLGLAALIENTIDPTRRAMCPGFFTLPGHTHRYRDWKPQGHGLMDLHDSIVQSCDVYFYRLALGLGIDAMHGHLIEFGFGAPTGIDIRGEKAGLMPSREWKQTAFAKPGDRVWFPGETVITGIGQGFTLTTPLQLAHATAAMATSGERLKPRLVAAIEDGVSGARQQIASTSLGTATAASEGQWAAIQQAMVGVTSEPRGSGYASMHTATYSVAGKSGTAQVFTIEQEAEYNEDDVEERLRDHGLFIAYAPVEDPTIALAVVVENGGGGSRAAAPVVRLILDAYFASGDYVAHQH